MVFEILIGIALNSHFEFFGFQLIKYPIIYYLLDNSYVYHHSVCVRELLFHIMVASFLIRSCDL
jgi:hypothetical protein